MNHSFNPSVDPYKCSKCHRLQMDHSNLAICEACPFIGPCELYPDYTGMLLCASCIEKEELIRNSPAKQQERINNLKLESSRALDYSIQVKEDIFNAQTVSINELKTVIDGDATITNKHFHLANELTVRYKHFSKVIFDKQAEIIEESNKQRAVQSYLNTLSNKLRLEEREKLKLNDMSYTPHEKPISKPKSINPVKKFDKNELVRCSNESGFPMAVIQMICVKKNMTPLEAIIHLKGIQ